MTSDHRDPALGWDWRSKSRATFKSMTKFWLKFLQWCNLNETIHIWTIVTLEGWHSNQTADHRDPAYGWDWMSKSRATFKSMTEFWLKFLQWCNLNETIHIWTIVTLEGWHSNQTADHRDPAGGQNLGHF